jgi:hypothetical protein
MTLVFQVTGLTAIKATNINEAPKVLVQLQGEGNDSAQAQFTLPFELGGKLNIGTRFALEVIHSGGIEECQV